MKMIINSSRKRNEDFGGRESKWHLSGRRRWIFSLKYLLAFLLIGLLLRLNILDYRLLTVLHQPGWLAPALFLQYVCFLITSGRFFFLIRSTGARTTYINCFILNMSSIFMMQLLPGGELIRLGIAGKSTEGRLSPILLSVVFDRLIGLWAMGIVALSAWLLSPFMFTFDLWALPGSHWILLIILALIVGPCFAMYIIIGEKRVEWAKSIAIHLPGFIRDRITDLFWVPQHGVSMKRVLGIGAFASLANHILMAVIVYFVARALIGSSVKMLQFFLLVPIGIAINAAIPLTPMGIGIGETAFHLLFQWIPGLPASDAGAEIMLIYRLVFIFSLLPGGILWTRLKKIYTS